MPALHSTTTETGPERERLMSWKIVVVCALLVGGCSKPASHTAGADTTRTPAETAAANSGGNVPPASTASSAAGSAPECQDPKMTKECDRRTSAPPPP